MSLYIQSNVSLQPFNSMAVQAQAEALVFVSTLDDVNEALDYAQERNMDTLVLGEGSNTLFEADYNGLVLLNCIKGIDIIEQDADSVTVRVAAGEIWHEFVDYSIEQGWFGLENLALIPGLVGAAPMQNIGAYGVEIKDSLLSVDYLDIATRKEHSLSNLECAFAYRESRFKNDLAGKVVITSITLVLSKKAQVNISYPALASLFEAEPSPRQVFDAVVSIREKKLPSPVHIPNTGSFFKNPVVSKVHFEELKKQHTGLVAYPAGDGFKLAAGWMIEAAGWKDKNLNGVTVHSEQALVLINPLKRSGGDVLHFAAQIQADIESKFGVALEIEPRVYR